MSCSASRYSSSEFAFIVFMVLLPPQHPCKDQRCNDSGVAFNNKFRRMDIQFPPGDLFVRYGSRIRSVGGSRIRDLAKIAPERNIVPFQVLVHHWYDADGEVSGDAASDLEKSDALPTAILPVPAGQPAHILDPAFNSTGL